MWQINNNLIKRLISIAVLLPIVLGILYVGGWFYYTASILLGCALIYEWHNIYAHNPKVFYQNRAMWLALSAFYVIMTPYSLILLFDENFLLLIFSFIVVWSIDCSAYIFGRLIGGAKILPSISPQKTWAGLFGGMLGAIIATSIFDIKLWYLGIILTIVSQSGDFFESWVKRKFGVKDSSNLIPGHGGFLDRIDGLVPVLILMTFLV